MNGTQLRPDYACPLSFTIPILSPLLCLPACPLKALGRQDLQSSAEIRSPAPVTPAHSPWQVQRFSRTSRTRPRSPPTSYTRPRSLTTSLISSFYSLILACHVRRAGRAGMYPSAILMGRECLDREAERSHKDLRDRRRRDTFVLPPFFGHVCEMYCRRVFTKRSHFSKFCHGV